MKKRITKLSAMLLAAVMLLSVVNTQLRDHYPTLTELAAVYMTDADAITETLAAINYHYDEGQNQFI